MTPQPLPLDPLPAQALRAAYDATPTINARYTFAQALSCKALAIALRLHAEALMRRMK